MDGSVNNARFNKILGICLDLEDNLIVADMGNHCIRKIKINEKQVVTLAGTPRNSGDRDGLATTAMFNSPSCVKVNSKGDIIVVDQFNHKIKVIDLKNNSVSTIAGLKPGYFDGSLSEARFSRPYAIAIDNYDNIYVSDLNNHRIRKIDVANNEVITVAGTGSLEIREGDASFTGLHGISDLHFTIDDKLLLCDYADCKVYSLLNLMKKKIL